MSNKLSVLSGTEIVSQCSLKFYIPFLFSHYKKFVSGVIIKVPTLFLYADLFIFCISNAPSFSAGETPESSDSGLAAPLDPPATVDTAAPEEQVGPVLSSLRLENQLLRSEVSSLNQEMASLVQRTKDTQEGEITAT